MIIEYNRETRFVPLKINIIFISIYDVWIQYYSVSWEDRISFNFLSVFSTVRLFNSILFLNKCIKFFN